MITNLRMPKKFVNSHARCVIDKFHIPKAKVSTLYGTNSLLFCQHWYHGFSYLLLVDEDNIWM